MPTPPAPPRKPRKPQVKPARRRRRKNRVKWSDLFYGAIGTGILVHETAITPTAEPALLFVALFLYGLIPMSRADGAKLGFRDLLLALAHAQLQPPGGTPTQEPQQQDPPPDDPAR